MQLLNFSCEIIAADFVVCRDNIVSHLIVVVFRFVKRNCTLSSTIYFEVPQLPPNGNKELFMK